MFAINTPLRPDLKNTVFELDTTDLEWMFWVKKVVVDKTFDSQFILTLNFGIIDIRKNIFLYPASDCKAPKPLFKGNCEKDITILSTFFGSGLSGW